MQKLLRKLDFAMVFFMAVIMTGAFSAVTYVLAAPTSSFNQTINPGTLIADIVNESYVPVSNPSFSLEAKTFSFSCQSSAGFFGTTTKQIYVQNPDAADGGWNLTLAASAPTVLWTGSAGTFDFNDPSGLGCVDGPDALDTRAGQMTVNPSAGVLTTANCASCTANNITKGSLASFNQGMVDDINILSAAAGSDDIGAWKLTGVAISQTIPAEQPAGNDYAINLTITATSV